MFHILFGIVDMIIDSVCLIGILEFLTHELYLIGYYHTHYLVGVLYMWINLFLDPSL